LKAIIIGGGIGGLATSCLLAKKGYEVLLLEKNEEVGGVASTFSAQGFTFDMGPSWYLMPDVFQNFFDLLGEKVEDHLDLVKLSPSYRIYFKGREKFIDMYSDVERDIPTLEQFESGAGKVLREYLELSKTQYEIALGSFMYKNNDTIFDFLNKEVAEHGRKLSVFGNMHDYVAKFFKSSEVQQILEYQLVFLGSSPYNAPALYNIMNHIDFSMGVYYPQGGIHTIPQALKKIGEKLGVEYRTNVPVKRILTGRGPRAKGVLLESGEKLEADLIVSNASIHHTETKLLPKPYRSFSERYWKTRTLAPSALILYLGLKDKVPGIAHHNLLFAPEWKEHFDEIFKTKKWPTDPSLYVCAPSISDPSVAPEGKENLFVLVPIAPGLKYSEESLNAYADKVLETIEREMKIPNLKERIEYKRLFSWKDFAARYNTQNGTALGLAHSLMQTAILRPNNVSKKLKNLFYVGANTNPGIGMPITLISAELAYKRIIGDKSSGHLEEL
jgi:phytoene desaturase